MTTVSIKKKVRIDHCHRCGGLMVPEEVHETGMVEWRCVSCGERIDPVIIEHRQKQVARVEAEKLFAGTGNARLN